MRLFGFNVIIFHASQFKTFSSSIQLKHTHNDFYFEHRKYIRQNEKKKKKKAVQTDVKIKQFKHQHK